MKMKPSFIALALTGILLTGRAASAQEPPAVPSDPTLGGPPPGAPPPADATPAPPPPPPAAAPPPAVVVVPPPPVVMAPAPVVEEPLAGVSNSNMFLRSPDNMFVFFPNGRLQSDLYFFKSDAPSGVPKNSFFVKRARLELAGWIDNVVYFQVGAEFASAPAPANSNYVATDDFVALAPWGDLAILQVGQFDAPFTLENRTSDKYFDFIERSLTVRAFGIPTNKEEGAMLHGTNDARNYYYSAGFFNGDGQNFKNLDNSFDFMGRGWISPTSFLGEGPLHDITLGGSYWTGNRNFANPLANQTTAGGFKILDASTPKLGMDTTTLNQQGRHHTWALEVNAPIAHKFGVRWEFVHKNQPLSVIDTTMGPTSIAAGMHLKGSSQYFEAWAWVMGDDRIVGEPGMQMPTRYKKFGVKPPQHGLMLAARLELLDETLSADDQGGPVALLAVKPNSYGQTKVTSFTLGANYWISKRFRTMFNWTLNDFGGDANYVTCPASMMPASCGSLKGLGNAKTEQEFSFRLAIAL